LNKFAPLSKPSITNPSLSATSAPLREIKAKNLTQSSERTQSEAWKLSLEIGYGQGDVFKKKSSLSEVAVTNQNIFRVHPCFPWLILEKCAPLRKPSLT
jgi:hypothetical protein